MQLTLHTGWGKDRETQLLAEKSADDFTFSMTNDPNDDGYVIRFVETSKHEPPEYRVYWMTMTKEEARQIAKFINSSLRYRKKELKEKGA